jgi:hypothetical protein
LCRGGFGGADCEEIKNQTPEGFFEKTNILNVSIVTAMPQNRGIFFYPQTLKIGIKNGLKIPVSRAYFRTFVGIHFFIS